MNTICLLFSVRYWDVSPIACVLNNIRRSYMVTYSS